MEQTTGDLSRGIGEAGEHAAAIVMIATGELPAQLVLPPAAELGRRIVAGAHTHELEDDRMSRDHARVAWDRGAWRITDLLSRNGTFVDGERITGEVRRRGDAVLRLGHTVFALLADGRGHPAPQLAPGAVLDAAGAAIHAAIDDAIAGAIAGPELARAHAAIRQHARAGAEALLIHGEAASGKQRAARTFHEAGPRRDGPFVVVNCGTIPEGVAERLLFGARPRGRPGGVPGAIRRLGHFQLAEGGTLFLDELADLEPVVQGTLLRVLEASAGPGLGLGLVAADDRELQAAVSERRFRADLYERLARVTVHLPPLRDRKVDAARIVQRAVAAAGLAAHAKLIEAVCARPWPGNLRELRDAIPRAIAEAKAARRRVVRASDLGQAGLPFGSNTGVTAVERRGATGEPLDRAALLTALARANGAVSAAARALGMHRSELHRLLEQYGIARDD